MFIYLSFILFQSYEFSASFVVTWQYVFWNSLSPFSTLALLVSYTLECTQGIFLIALPIKFFVCLFVLIAWIL